MCYKIYSIIFWFFITLPCLANCEMINDNESVQYGLNSGGINAARHLLDSKVGDWKKLCGLPKVDLIKKLNAFVYNYCKKPMSNLVLSNINDLFDKCYTACGGRSYVLRGLLAVYGIKSDYRNIYNIPIQGNHSAVEVNLNNKLSFLDPTFGTFFSSQSAYDAPLSLDEIIFSFDKKKIKKTCLPVKKNE